MSSCEVSHTVGTGGTVHTIISRYFRIKSCGTLRRSLAWLKRGSSEGLRSRRHGGSPHMLTATTADQDASPVSPSPMFKWWAAAAVILGAITMDFGGNVLNVAVPKMMTSFGVSLDKIQWVLTGY